MKNVSFPLNNGITVQAIAHPHEQHSTIECSVLDSAGNLIDYLDFPDEEALFRYFWSTAEIDPN